MQVEPIHLTGLGLALDIVGIIILFFYSPPASIWFDDGSEAVQTQPNPESAAKMRRQKSKARLGLGLLLAGFVLQLIGNYLK